MPNERWTYWMMWVSRIDNFPAVGSLTCVLFFAMFQTVCGLEFDEDERTRIRTTLDRLLSEMGPRGIT